MKRLPLSRLCWFGLCSVVATLCYTHASATDWNAGQLRTRADTIDIAPISGVHLLRGDVTVERGPDKVTAEWVELKMKNNELSLLTARGAPVRFSSEARSHGRSGRTGLLIITAAEIQYQVARRQVLARGQVQVDDNGRKLSGERLVHDLRTGSYRIVGAKTGGAAIEVEEFEAP